MNSHPVDLVLLAKSLRLVEKFAVPKYRIWIENSLVNLALMLGLPIPDFSIGEGQVRISSVIKTLENPEVYSQKSNLLRNHIASSLLNRCSNFRYSLDIISDFLEKNGIDGQRLSRSIILRVARNYNGQQNVKDAEAEVSNLVYRELVYNVYHYLRFNNLK